MNTCNKILDNKGHFLWHLHSHKYVYIFKNTGEIKPCTFMIFASYLWQDKEICLIVFNCCTQYSLRQICCHQFNCIFTDCHFSCLQCSAITSIHISILCIYLSAKMSLWGCQLWVCMWTLWSCFHLFSQEVKPVSTLTSNEWVYPLLCTLNNINLLSL